MVPITDIINLVLLILVLFHYLYYALQILAFMCCPFILCVMTGVSNKAYSDPCDCLLNEMNFSPLCKQLQEHSLNEEYIHLGTWNYDVPSRQNNDTNICVCICRLLQDHHSVQSCSDCRAVCRLFHSPLPAHRREGSAYRR